MSTRIIRSKTGRPPRKCYYRRVREKGRRRNVYIGTGFRGTWNSLFDIYERHVRRSKRDEERIRLAELRAIDARVANLCAAVELTTAVVLATARRKGEL